MAGHIVSLAQQKGGTGKTTVAAHIAVAWLERGHTVAILDVDPQGSLGEWLEARERRLGEDGTGLSFRTASGWGARREARFLARDHDLVVVDTPPKAELDAKPAIEAADLVIVPVQPTPVDLWATEATLHLAAKERTPALLVMNRVPPRARLTEEMARALGDLEGDLAATRLGNRVSYAASVGAGSTAIESEPRGKAAREMQALAAEIAARLS